MIPFFMLLCRSKQSSNPFYMEIKITDLEHIHEAAKAFIAAMGDNTVLAFTEDGSREYIFH